MTYIVSSGALNSTHSLSCSRFNTKIDDLSALTVTQMRRHYQSALNDELVNATSVSCLFVMEHIRLLLILMRLTCSSTAFFCQKISCTMCILYRLV